MSTSSCVVVGDGASARMRVPLRLTVADTIGRLHSDQDVDEQLMH